VNTVLAPIVHPGSDATIAVSGITHVPDAL